MNKWILYIFYKCCLLPWGVSAEAMTERNELEVIEQKMHTLRVALQKDRLTEMKEEVNGQGLMIADWEAYSHELQQIRKREEEEKQIEIQIKKLEQQKAQILKKQFP